MILGQLPGTVREWKLLLTLMSELEASSISEQEPPSAITSVSADTKGSTPSLPLGRSTKHQPSTLPNVRSSLEAGPRRGSEPLDRSLSTAFADGTSPGCDGRENIPTAELVSWEGDSRRDSVFESPSHPAKAKTPLGSPKGTGFSGQTGHDITRLGVLKHMLRCLGPQVVSEVMTEFNDRRGDGGGEEEVEKQLHFLLVQLSSVHTQQR